MLTSASHSQFPCEYQSTSSHLRINPQKASEEETENIAFLVNSKRNCSTEIGIVIVFHKESVASLEQEVTFFKTTEVHCGQKLSEILGDILCK